MGLILGRNKECWEFMVKGEEWSRNTNPAQWSCPKRCCLHSNTSQTKRSLALHTLLLLFSSQKPITYIKMEEWQGRNGGGGRVGGGRDGQGIGLFTFSEFSKGK